MFTKNFACLSMIVVALSVVVTVPSQAFGQTQSGSTALAVSARSLPAVNRGSWLPNAKIPTSLSAEQQKWMQILSQPRRDLADSSTLSAKELCDQLTAWGVPTLIHLTALEDSLQLDTKLKLPLEGIPLLDRVLVAIYNRNATLMIRDQHLAIISLDDAEDTRYFTLVAYDVSSLLRSDNGSLKEYLLMIVTTDAWIDSGYGFATLEILENQGQFLLSANASFETHRQLHKHLEYLAQVSRNHPADFKRSGGYYKDRYDHSYYSARQPSTVKGGSTAVSLPQRRRPNENANGGERRRPNENANGGMGGGGGVF